MEGIHFKKKKNIFLIVYLLWKNNMVLTSCCFFLKIIDGFIPGAYVFAYTAFIDKTLVTFIESDGIDDLYLPFLFLLLINFLGYVINTLYILVLIKIKLSLHGQLTLDYINKCTKLKYYYYENEKYLDLMIYRTSSGLPDKIMSGFTNCLEFFKIILEVIVITVIIASNLIFSALIIMVCFSLIIIVSLYFRTDEYKGFAEYQKLKERVIAMRKYLHLENILMKEIYTIIQIG